MTLFTAIEVNIKHLISLGNQKALIYQGMKLKPFANPLGTITCIELCLHCVDYKQCLAFHTYYIGKLT